MKSIIIVDDDLLISELVRFMLEKAGYSVHCCTEPPAALAEVKSGTYDLIIFDITMPTLNGLQFIEEVRKELKGPQVPILVLASSFDKTMVLKAKALGVHHFLIKPPAREDLLNLVAQMVGLAQNRNAG